MNLSSLGIVFKSFPRQLYIFLLFFPKFSLLLTFLYTLLYFLLWKSSAISKKRRKKEERKKERKKKGGEGEKRKEEQFNELKVVIILLPQLSPQAESYLIHTLMCLIHTLHILKRISDTTAFSFKYFS